MRAHIPFPATREEASMGKPIVISDVIERYRDTVFRLTFTYLRNQADADDIT